MSINNHVGRTRLNNFDAWPAIERYTQILREKTAVEPGAILRFERHRAWLECAISTRDQSATAQEVCANWSRAADELIQSAWRESGCIDLPYAVLALGKLGSNELNLSSDVDLILVRQDDAEIDLTRVRRFHGLLSEMTEFGYCLRVDFSIRPGGKSSALVPSVSEFEFYYGNHGETWERLALVRSRWICGHRSTIESLRPFIQKYVYRRHLDFTLFDDLRHLRAKIREEHYQTNKKNLFHLKLGAGGIRDLELFVHALQVIHGGRRQSLQTASTDEALERFENAQILPKEEVEFLRSAYWRMRAIENCLHGYEDRQTYSIDFMTPPAAVTTAWVNDLPDLARKVHELTSSLLGATTKALSAAEPSAERLGALGFNQQSIDETWPQLLQATALSRKTTRDEQARLEFLSGFVSALSEVGLDCDLGLSLLLDFVRATRAKASFFTLLNRETKLRNNLARLFSISPYLGSILSSRPEVIDEFILRRQASPNGDLDTVLEELAERRLLTELISANEFLDAFNIKVLMKNLTQCADDISLSLLSRLKAEYGESSIEILSLGKWGGGEIGFRSDLDFIFITDHEPTALDQKIAKRFVSRMTESHRGGAIYSVYEIDLRLRPSGHAGPILVEQSELIHYLKNEAAAWERQAYLRSRVLTRPTHRLIAETAAARRLSQTDREALADIRNRLFVGERAAELDLKLSRGGLADIEFAAQIALLEQQKIARDSSTETMIEYLEQLDTRWQKCGNILRAGHQELRKLEQVHQLATSTAGSKLRTRSDDFRRLALAVAQDQERLEERVRFVLKQNCEALDSIRGD